MNINQQLDYVSNYCRQGESIANANKHIPEAREYADRLNAWKEKVQAGAQPDWLDIEKLMKRLRHIQINGHVNPKQP